MAEARISTESKSIFNGNGLILYYNISSYYSQRVCMVLHEKNLKYKSQIISLSPSYDFHKPWFLKLNPEGQIPVLCDGVKIIPDSSRIIDYLEDNFSNGSTPRLVPDKGSDEYNTVKKFRDEIEAISVKILTYGCCVHTELTGNISLSDKKKQVILDIKEKIPSNLKKYQEENPSLHDVYSKKIAQIDMFQNILEKKETVIAEMDKVKALLEKVESELSSHSQDDADHWFCSKKFTVADIYLAVLLGRLKAIGLSFLYWEAPENKYPYLKSYYNKVMARKSVKSVFTQLDQSSKGCSFINFGIIGFSTLAVGLGAIFLYKRLK